LQPRHLLCIEGSFPNRESVCEATPELHSKNLQVATGARLYGRLEVALTAGRRGSSEEFGVPIANDRARLDNRCGTSDSDQDYYSRGNRDRSRRVHRDAERAMARVALQSMYVRHLDHSHHRQQRQTQQSGCPESAWLPAASATGIWLQSCEQKHLQLQGYIELDATGMARVSLSAGACAEIGDQPASPRGRVNPETGDNAGPIGR